MKYLKLQFLLPVIPLLLYAYIASACVPATSLSTRVPDIADNAPSTPTLFFTVTPPPVIATSSAPQTPTSSNETPQASLTPAASLTAASETPTLQPTPHPDLIWRRNEHSQNVHSLAFSPDGLLLASGDKQQQVHIWDVASGTILASLDMPADFYDLAFSPDGSLLSASLADGTVRLWNTVTWQQMRILPVSENNAPICLFTPDGKRLVSGSNEGLHNYKVWDLTSGRLLQSNDAHADWVISLSLSPDGRFAATASMSEDPTVKVWRLGDGAPVITLENKNFSGTWVDFSSDGKYLLVANRDTLETHIYRVGDWSLVATPSVFSTQFAPQGYGLLIWSNESFAVWDIAQDAIIFEHDLPNSTGLSAAAFNLDGSLLAIGSPGGEIALWKSGLAADQAQPVRPATAPWQPPLLASQNILRLQSDSAVRSLAFSPDGRMLAAGEDHRLSLWDLASGSLHLAFPGDKTSVPQVTFSPDSAWLAYQQGALITLLRGDDFTPTRILKADPSAGSLSDFAFTPDSARLVAAYEAMIDSWDLASGKLDEQAWAGVRAAAISISGDGEQFFIGSADGQVVDITDNSVEPLTSYRLYALTVLALSPDGKLLAAGNDSGTFMVWDLDWRQPVYLVEDLIGPLQSLQFSPDGQYLLAADDFEILLLDLETGLIAYPLPADENQNVSCAAFSSDGRQVALGFQDGRIQVWQLPLMK